MTAVPRGYLLAADVGGTRVRMLLAQADGKPVARWDTHIPGESKHPAGVVALLRTGADAMLATVPPAPLLHVTVGAPGTTDVRCGVVLQAPNLPGWTDVPLRDLLEAEFQIAAVVDNDTNLAALGEGAAGAAQGVQDYVFCAMGTGVGAGIVVNGRLLRGATGSAGEIGYLQPLGTPRHPVRMDETGALERQIGGLGIEVQWRETLHSAGLSHDEALATLRAPQVFDRADAGHPQATVVMRWAADLLAEALTTLTLVLDPALVVLGGGVGAHAGLCAAVTESLRRNGMASPRVVPSALGAAAQLHGAVATSRQALAAELPFSSMHSPPSSEPLAAAHRC